MHKSIKFKAHGLEFILRIASDSNNYVGIIYPFYVDAIINWDDSEEFLQKESILISTRNKLPFISTSMRNSTIIKN